MYSAIAEASIKDLEIKDNKAMVHTEKSYKENIWTPLCLDNWLPTIWTAAWHSLQKLRKAGSKPFDYAFCKLIRAFEFLRVIP